MTALANSLPPEPDLNANPPGPLAGAMGPQPAMGALQGVPGAPQDQQQAAPAPAPTHEQAVAALRHFQAIIAEGRTLLKNPDIGKASIKSAIQDGAVKLVADGIISAADAVSQLATVPERPFDQKQWVEKLYVNAVQAQAAVLDHHRAAHIGTGDYGIESQMHKSDPDMHKQTLAGMMETHYRGKAA